MSGCLHGDAVFYNVKVSNGFNNWFVSKRYSQFEHLHSILSSLYPTKMIDTAFPPKQYKLLVSHYTPEFIEERKILLNNYFSKCLVLVEVFKSSEFIEFMNTDKIEDFEPVVANPYIIPLTEELPDDLEVTEINLPAVRYMSDHVLFQVDVVNCRKRKTFQKWTVLKRYGQFWEMDVSLRESLLLMGNDLVKFLPIFPPRKVKLLQDHMEPSFVEVFKF